jgi:hypothetical protein
MSAAIIDPPISKGRRRHPDLLFEWVVNRGYRWRLLVFLNLSLALHVACFYAFQVVYTPTARQRPETTKVTFLDPRNDAGVRDVIRRIEDRAVFFDGSLRLSVPGASLEAVNENQVLPVPSFATHEPSLKTPPPIDLAPELPGIFAPGEVFLPRQSRLLPGGKPTERPVPFAGPYIYRPQLGLLGGVTDLEIAEFPDWSDFQDEFAGVDDNHIHFLQFLVEVDGFGRITSCLPWKGIENAFDAAAARKIEKGLKFSPNGLTTRGWLEVRW